jgi:hypothetical protein
MEAMALLSAGQDVAADTTRLELTAMTSTVGDFTATPAAASAKVGVASVSGTTTEPATAAANPARGTTRQEMREPLAFAAAALAVFRFANALRTDFNTGPPPVPRLKLKDRVLDWVRS